MSPRGRACAALGGLSLLLGLLTACGEEAPAADYCGDYLAAQDSLAGTGDGQDALAATLATFEDLRSGAPEDLSDEWDTVVFAYRDLADAVDDTGVDPARVQDGRLPEDLSGGDRRRLRRVASTLQSARVLAAAQGLDDYAEQVCMPGDDPTDGGVGGVTAGASGGVGGTVGRRVPVRRRRPVEEACRGGPPRGCDERGTAVCDRAERMATFTFVP